MKGIILAGGSGTRLYPITQGVSKQLLPIYDKPMIYYPLSVLMLAGINDILIITTPEHQEAFKSVLGNGDNFGIKLSYAVQNEPKGLAQAFIIAESFIAQEQVCLVLGDNIFWGQGFLPFLKRAISRQQGATIFGYPVNDPERFGVIEFNQDKKVISIEEKPSNPKSKFAITGLYFFDSNVIDYAKSVKPSKRGELEITDIIQCYLANQELSVELLGRGFAWLDTGTHESLLEASTFVETIEKRQGNKIACLEEVAFHNNWISRAKLIELSKPLMKSKYGEYLMSLANQEI